MMSQPSCPAALPWSVATRRMIHLNLMMKSGLTKAITLLFITCAMTLRSFLLNLTLLILPVYLQWGQKQIRGSGPNSVCVCVCVSNLNERVNYLVDKPSPVSECLCLCIMWPKVNQDVCVCACACVLPYFPLDASVLFLLKSHLI